MLARHGLQHQRGVHHCARHRVDAGEVGEHVRRHVVRHHAGRLLEANDAVGGGGNAGRAARIGAHADRAYARGEGHPRTARRAT